MNRTRAIRWAGALLAIMLGFEPLRAEAPLVSAIKGGDKTAVRLLLERHADVNAAEPDGATALHWAAYLDDVETVNLLIRAGARATAANRHGVTPLQLACVNGDAAVIARLLEAGADPNAALPRGETALMTAARTGKLAAVRTLLAHGAAVNAVEEWRGQTALMWAAGEGHAEVVTALLDHGADLRARSGLGFTPFLFAVREGRIAAARALLRAGADVNDSLPETREYGLRRKGINPKENAHLPIELHRISALLLATENAHYELAVELLDAGADASDSRLGWTALHEVTWVRKPGYGNNKPAPPGSGSVTSLELVKALVAHGADVNARMSRRHPGTKICKGDLNYVCATPFLMAAKMGDVELMRLLVELGADPTLPNGDNATPFLIAVGVGTHDAGEDSGTESEALEAAKLALQWGGDVNAVDGNGETAMHGAAYSQFPALVRFLAEHGAKLEVWNRKNRYGWTPLEIALGVQRCNNIQASAETAAAIRKLMEGAATGSGGAAK